jgi:C-terminal processing protease CtpA/Prc
VLKATGRHILAGLLAIWLASCGGNDEAKWPGGDGPGTSEWKPGVFAPAENFESHCEEPRLGVNPFTNRPYSDVQGTIADENNFLRSYSNDTYLWYDEIIDQDPALFDDQILYFNQLKTNAITASGQPKDKFHFVIGAEEYASLSQSGVAAGYGVQWALLSSVPPREILVAYTEPGSPATDPQVALERGAKVLAIDGFDVDTETDAGINALNAALFPSEAGNTHTFTVQDRNSKDSRSITMTSAFVESEPVKNVGVLETPTGRVGYILFNDHIATAELGLFDAVNQLNEGEGIDDLVLDMRYNGGGFLALASELAYMIAGPTATDGRAFELTEFNDKHPVNNPLTGRPISPTPFYDTTLGSPFNAPEGQSLPTLDLQRVFVLTSGSTCSASEAVINGLRGIDVEVIQIGTTTCGKPYGFYATDNCGIAYFTIQFRGVNDDGFGDYTDGFSPANTQGAMGVLVPGCSVADDFTAELGDENEDRLAAALSYRETATCPTPPELATSFASKSGADRGYADVLVPKSPWQTNRTMLP